MQDGHTITISATTLSSSSSGSSNGNGASQEMVQEIIYSEPDCKLEYCGQSSQSAGSLIAQPLIIHHGSSINSSSSATHQEKPK